MAILEVQDGDKLRVPVGTELVVRQIGVRTRFTMLIDDGIFLLNERLSNKLPLAYKLFFILAEALKPKQDNVAPLHVTSLVEYFGCSKRSLYDAMQILKETDLMRKQSKGHYWLNPYVVWCGSTKSRVKFIQQWDNNVSRNTKGITNG